jgi:large subunit ribosomal protein L4
MAKASVLNWDKKSVGEIELPASVFEQPLRKDLLHTVVRWQLACRRQGTSMTKTKGLVSGGGKKPFKQKGTGNARQGSTRSPLNPGGGTMFGPQPRDYSYKLPRKVKQAGLRTALSYLQSSGKFFVVDDMTSKGKTGELVKRLKSFGLEKAVLIDAAADASFDRASRNLKTFRYYSVDGLNVFDLLKYDAAVVTKSSLERILTRCGVDEQAGK